MSHRKKVVHARKTEKTGKRDWKGQKIWEIKKQKQGLRSKNVK